MKKLLFVLAISIFLFSCSEKKEDNKDDNSKDEQTDEQSGGDENSSSDESGNDSKTDPVGDKSVLDFYNMLPVSKEYKITKKGSKYVTMSNADYEMGATVDMKNGFIEINDDGTGGGSVNVQVVLFLDNDKGAYIGYSRFSFDGIATASDAFDFYTYNDASLNKNTGKIIETMNKSAFLKSAYTPSGDEKEAWNQMDVIYKLPRNGTTVFADLTVEPACGFGSMAGNVPHPDLCDAISFARVSYNWDMKTGTFKVGKKQ